jgi:hypothetical protein
VKPRPVQALLLVALAGAVGAVLLQGRRTREDHASVLRALRAAQGPVLPAAARAGAASATDPARYDRDRLYELVDGAAEAYLSRGFQACVASTYSFAGAVEVVAEAHRFESQAGAEAQLAAERPRAAEAVPGIPAAVSDGQVLLAPAGRDLLKLTALTPGPTGRGALVALAAAWHQETTP